MKSEGIIFRKTMEKINIYWGKSAQKIFQNRDFDIPNRDDL